MFAYLWMCGYEQKEKSPSLAFAFPSVPFYFLLFPPFSPSLLLLIAVLLRRTRLALINVPGIHLALRLFSPLSSLFQLHPAFCSCRPGRRNTSRLQLQLVTVLSRIQTHTHTAGACRCGPFLCPALLFKSFTPAALSIMMDL